MDDARLAVETGVGGNWHVFLPAGALARQGHDLHHQCELEPQIPLLEFCSNASLQTAIEVIEFVKSKGLEIRFSKIRSVPTCRPPFRLQRHRQSRACTESASQTWLDA